MVFSLERVYRSAQYERFPPAYTAELGTGGLDNIVSGRAADRRALLATWSAEVSV
ncbi:hypothetical protein [Janthinobacterium sp.]|uniref:hypothetical protein n=1 Tax=Janthinobacterium sp. TaxID=1871054 RepID=UPI00293D87DB|nr:hypothetical protein [Janthinobacterium sp.]